MKLIVDYLKFHRKSVFLFIACLLIFAMVFFLSNVPLGAVLYAGLLCLLTAFFFAAYDFARFRKHHRELLRLIEPIDSQIDYLPEPRNLIDQDYTEMIRELHRQKRESESKAYLGRKELTDYFTLWAHQIKTPIAAMGMILQTKKQEQYPEVKELSAELFNIEEYVNTAMSYIRLQDISSDLVFEEISLDQLIRKTLKKYARMFIGKKISMDFQETDYTAVTDEKWLSVVLGQILVNSLKYTPEGGTITIFMEGHRLMIRDTGPGIPAEDLPRVFEKGFTGHNGRLYGKSTGQGLYLCRTIMDKLSHGIAVNSEPGQGTTVVLDLFRETFQ
ncbi:sensor histidine kinase [Anaerovorax odorimutans]|uniref:histidine kinase n=1 Tax=Anaerovorax odorimutans TaxID=109327 RepID=A0ABT1RRZ4_9FIRM|nr:sensor histidine kinase [Anaerovorax odorimutans]MCQ4637646.1 sensor histidine kinase [Anaerovorax odorimutans]